MIVECASFRCEEDIDLDDDSSDAIEIYWSKEFLKSLWVHDEFCLLHHAEDMVEAITE